MKTKSVTIQTPDATSRVEHKRLPDVKTPNANSMLHNCPCKITSVYIAASLAVLVLAAIAFTVAMTTKNWSASGTRMRMGLWDYCIIERGNITWTCHPVNTDFSVATQAFSILSAMCYACISVLYFLYLVFSLKKSRPLVIAMCLVVFATVSLNIMTLIVYATKNREMFLKIEKNYFPGGRLDDLYLSWSYYFAITSTIMATVAGVLFYLEFKQLTFHALYNVPSDQTLQC